MAFLQEAFALENLPFLFGAITGAVLVRYFFVAGAAYWICHRLMAVRWQMRRIQPLPFRKGQLQREILYSLSTVLIFGIVGTAGMAATQAGLTLVYFDVAKYGWMYFVLSFPLTILVHDAYFYWGHRFMHWKPIFPYVHALHHRSTNPSPFAAFAFHPLEALVEVGIFLIFLFIIPLHIYVIAVFFSLMILWNVYVHVGMEFLPKRWAAGFVGRWLGTPTHHNVHHRVFSGNYGLWFNAWDRVMGTNHPTYMKALIEKSSATEEGGAREK